RIGYLIGVGVGHGERAAVAELHVTPMPPPVGGDLLFQLLAHLHRQAADHRLRYLRPRTAIGATVARAGLASQAYQEHGDPRHRRRAGTLYAGLEHLREPSPD